MRKIAHIPFVFKSEIDVCEIQHMGGDVHVAAAAKVSVSPEEAAALIEVEKVEGITGLIGYLVANRHGTPFEHSALTIRVHAPIFVWREWHRHRIGVSYNEESARYRTLDPVFYVPSAERPLMKVEGWKPGRPKFAQAEDDHAWISLCENLRVVYRLAYRRYLENLGLGVDPGVARACLPVGIYSSCWVTFNPRSIMAFLSLRTSGGAEGDPEARFPSYPLYEIEVAARKVEEILAQHWPITHAAFVKNGRVAP